MVVFKRHWGNDAEPYDPKLSGIDASERESLGLEELHIAKCTNGNE